MAEYYLISQLPSLDGITDSTPIPITEERFFELCSRLLGKKAVNEINNLTLMPPRDYEPTGSGLIDAWCLNEHSLRLALAKVRAEKMKKSYDIKNKMLSSEHIKAASAALEMEDPMEAEKYLNRYRIETLETLRPMDSFSRDYVYYYGLKLKLLLRIRKFDTERGEASYKKIYTSILNGDDSEAKQ